jgi:3-carboxy-cis,cis-muconate cycloisomerase
MRPPSSPSDDLGDALTSSAAVLQATSSTSWLRAMVEFEVALALAGAEVGRVPGQAAHTIARCLGGEALAEDVLDVPGILAEAPVTGTPVVPLLSRLRNALPARARGNLHVGATSQDVVDTALALVLRRTARVLLADALAVADACAALAEQHRRTPAVARTLGQHALPTTFGRRAAGWLVAVDTAAAELQRAVALLPVQLGGAVGTTASLGDHGPAMTRFVAQRLGLAEPTLPWHGDRLPVARVASALAMLAGTAEKVARDLLLLASGDVREVRLRTGGASSAMPHKQNPVPLVLAAAAAHRVPGLLSTVLSGMAGEGERATGAWQAEGATVLDLARATGGTLCHLREALAVLEVDEERMAEGLQVHGDLLLSEAAVAAVAEETGWGPARRAVEQACRRQAAHGGTLEGLLLADPEVSGRVAPGRLHEALDPRRYLGSAEEHVVAALRHHHCFRTAGDA